MLKTAPPASRLRLWKFRDTLPPHCYLTHNPPNSIKSGDSGYLQHPTYLLTLDGHIYTTLTSCQCFQQYSQLLQTCFLALSLGGFLSLSLPQSSLGSWIWQYTLFLIPFVSAPSLRANLLLRQKSGHHGAQTPSASTHLVSVNLLSIIFILGYMYLNSRRRISLGPGQTV